MNSQDATEDVALDFGNEEIKKKRFRYPVASFFHLFFRVSALIIYLFCEIFSSKFVAPFVIIVIFLAADFWTVKNITGRLLVGLRWWNQIDEDGKSHWVYESRKKVPGKHNKETTTESKLFWLGLVITTIFWGLLLIVCLFTLKIKWLTLVCIALCLQGANLYGYVRCKIGGKKQLSSYATSFLSQQILNRARSSLNKEDNQENI